MFQNICAFNMPTCLQAEFLALCLPEHVLVQCTIEHLVSLSVLGHCQRNFVLFEFI